ncbi:MAG: hypothetical protein KAJ40_05790 [Alphaproteobacteria bacterium]|nr:hypothetical protein [Alphaproteobacteria bacterium]
MIDKINAMEERASALATEARKRGDPLCAAVHFRIAAELTKDPLRRYVYTKIADKEKSLTYDIFPNQQIGGKFSAS